MSQLSFENKVALVTGVSRGGLGFRYARDLAARGCHVVVNDLGVDWRGALGEAETKTVVEALRAGGAEVHGVTGDVVEDSARIVAETVDRFGKLDILVNNAGAGGDFEQQVQVHLVGAHRMSDAAWPHLVASGSAAIVNISSAGSYGAPAMPGYAAAKGGIISLTRTQAIIGAPHGVRSNVILPNGRTGATDTISVKGFQDFMTDLFGGDWVSSFVTYLLHSSCDVTGQGFAVGGGLVTRVVQAENAGATVDEASAEAWQDVIGDIMSNADWTVASTMWEQVQHFSRKLSPEAFARWEELGIDLAVTGRAH